MKRYWRHYWSRYYYDSNNTEKNFSYATSDLSPQEFQEQLSASCDRHNEKYPSTPSMDRVTHIMDILTMSHEITKEDYDNAAARSIPIQQIIWQL